MENKESQIIDEIDQVKLQTSQRRHLGKYVQFHEPNLIKFTQPNKDYHAHIQQIQSYHISQNKTTQLNKFQNLKYLVTKICLSKVFYNCFLILLCCFLLCCLCSDPYKNQNLANIAQICQLVCQLIFIFFLMCRLIKWKDQNYIWLALDFITIVSGILGYAIVDDNISRYFKAIRTLKLLFLIKQIEILNKPAYALVKALTKYGTLLIPAIIIIYIYAVVGLYAFSDFEYNRCRSSQNLAKPQNWTLYQKQIFLCGQITCPITQQNLQCLNPIDYQVQPNQDELQNMIQGNGLLKYSNIFYAILSTFKQTFITGSSRLIVLYKQVLNPIFVQIYFYTFIYLISYIYLNILYSNIITCQWDGQVDPNQQNKAIKTTKVDNHVQILQNMQNKQQQKHQIQNNNSSLQQTQSNLIKNKSLNNSQIQPNIITKEKQKINGFLSLKKQKFYNIFQNIQIIPQQCISKNSMISQTKKQISQSKQLLSLSDYYPQGYKKYEIVNNIIILLCCINLSLDFHGQSQEFKFIVDCIDFVFYCLLILEIIIKILIERYALRKLQLFTILQLVIVIVCTSGVIYQAVTASDFVDFLSCDNTTCAVLRSFKYLRIMILILRSTIFSQARLILQSTFRSLYIIRHMVIVWLIIVIIFAIIGFHLHSYKTKIDIKTGKLDMINGQGYQVSFDGIFQSTIFTMLTFYNQQWDYLMFQQYLGSGTLVIIWQLISLCVGLLLFSKYFMALLMKQLDKLIDNNVANEQIVKQNQTQNSDQNSSQQLFKHNKIVPLQNQSKIQKKNLIIDGIQHNKFIFRPKQQQKKIIHKKSKKFQFIDDKNSNPKVHCVKIIVFHMQRILQHKIYKIIFCCFIISSCIVLMQTHPHVDRTSSQAQPYLILNIINKVFFIIDLFLNLMVYGLFQQADSYLRKSWLNWINIIIIVFEIICLPTVRHSYIFDKIQKIQVLRILYFLQIRYKNDWNMRITYHAFVQLLPKVLTLLIITSIMYIYFALILVKLYKNDFYSCYNYYEQVDIITKEDCMLWGGDWVQNGINVSNILDSTLFLFSIATMQGWINLLIPMMNLAGDDRNPIRDTNKYISIFFVFVFFFGNLIMLNVFIGLSVSNFKRLKDKTTGQSKLNKKQKQWLSVKTQIYRLKPLILDIRPKNCVRGYAFDIFNSTSYRIIRIFFFCCFLISMSFFTSNMSPTYRHILKYIQCIFAGLLILQYIIQLLAFWIRIQYLKSFIYKTLVVIYAIVFVIVSQKVKLQKFDQRIMGSIFLVLQFIRYLSLIDQIPYAKKLLNIILTVLPQTSNIFLMICITLFTYTIIGMELFSYLRPNIQLDIFNQNYTNFSTALFALIKFSSLEAPFQQISDAAQNMTPNFICQEINTYDDFLKYGRNGCGNQLFSYVFFLSFHVFYGMLLMSMVVAVIVDSYIEVKRQQQAPITKLVLQKVRQEWAKIDPQAIGYIPYRQFWMFAAKLLEIYKKNQNKQQNTENEGVAQFVKSKEQLLKKMSIAIYENQNGVLCFQFNQVIQALTKIYMQQNLGTIVSKKTEKMFQQRKSSTQGGFKKSFYTSSHVATLIILKSGLRSWKKLATNQAGRLQYKNFISKFNKAGAQTTTNKQ